MSMYEQFGLRPRNEWGFSSATENYKAQRWELGFWLAVCGVTVLIILAELL